MSRRGAVWAWLVGGGLAVAVLAALTAHNAGRAGVGERPGARKAVLEQVLGTALPYRLAGRERRQLLNGADALDEIARLHGGQLALTGGRVARYDTAPGITVWAGQAASAAAAREMVRDMRHSLAAGRSPFRLHEAPAGGGTPEVDAGVAYATGLGQEHALFASGAQVVWVAAPTALLGRALDELDASLPR